ncbi:TetR/AcrR family transcriptional regulator [Hwanghaeella sp. 1Z406]|jgi:AcrR family transcriptional regulator|uniref:TetR/AcrR family transcriptional regulator n=1 Tax=Hwanghaeella sp. 1Z406 TaxID=3402811 RepID=UPI003B66F6C3|tara:strand:+ start:189 stop:884 length:696 start_codon:yes stop_codon:yes gene_type:complete
MLGSRLDFCTDWYDTLNVPISTEYNKKNGEILKMSAGRQRAFDKEEALDAAMTVFWQNGYAGTSMAALTGAMGINKPSLYAAFGNKEDLFIAALRRYIDNHGKPHTDPLFEAGRPIMERLRNFLKRTAETQCNPNLPGGCLMALSTSESNADGFPPNALKAICDTNAQILDTLTNFFTDEIKAGTLKDSHEPKALALFVIALTQGMAVSAKNGASPEDLQAIIDQAMAAFS